MSPTRLRVVAYSSAIVLAAGLVFAGFGITFPPDPGTRLSGAMVVASLGDYDGALAICDKVLEEHPDNVNARVYRATFLAQAERYKEALAAYDDVLGRIDDDADLRRRVRADHASVLLHAGRNAEFRTARDRLAEERLDGPVHLLDGMAALKGGDQKGAEAAFRRALSDDPENAVAKGMLLDTLATRAQDAVVQRRFQDALVDYRAARALEPGSVSVALKTAEVHLALEQEAAALRVLREIGLTNRGVAPMAFRAATALLERGEKEDALSALATAHKADASATEALFKKEAAWAEIRKQTTLSEIVSVRNSRSGARLPHRGPVIGSRGTVNKG